MIFQWNIKEWVKLLLPPRFKTAERLQAMLEALLDGVEAAYNTFMAFRNHILYRLQYTGQTIWLERLLNERFNSGQPAFENEETRTYPSGIYIDTPSGSVFIYRFTAVESRREVMRWRNVELSVDPTRRQFRRTAAEFVKPYQFIVRIPTAVLDLQNPSNTSIINNMRSWIEQYRIAGNNYIVENYIP